MEKDVFPDPAVGILFNENFINAKVNVDSVAGKNLEAAYNMNSTPTLLFIDVDGKLIKKITGFQRKESLILLAKEVLKK